MRYAGVTTVSVKFVISFDKREKNPLLCREGEGHMRLRAVPKQVGEKKVESICSGNAGQLSTYSSNTLNFSNN